VRKALNAKGKLVQTAGKGGLTVQRTIGGAVREVLYLRAADVFAPAPEHEQ